MRVRADPPDPRFRTVARPAKVRRIVVRPGAGLGRADARRLTTLLASQARASALSRRRSPRPWTRSAARGRPRTASTRASRRAPRSATPASSRGWRRSSSRSPSLPPGFCASSRRSTVARQRRPSSAFARSRPRGKLPKKLKAFFAAIGFDERDIKRLAADAKRSHRPRPPANARRGHRRREGARAPSPGCGVIAPLRQPRRSRRRVEAEVDDRAHHLGVRREPNVRDPRCARSTPRPAAREVVQRREQRQQLAPAAREPVAPVGVGGRRCPAAAARAGAARARSSRPRRRPRAARRRGAGRRAAPTARAAPSAGRAGRAGPRSGGDGAAFDIRSVVRDHALRKSKPRRRPPSARTSRPASNRPTRTRGRGRAAPPDGRRRRRAARAVPHDRPPPAAARPLPRDRLDAAELRHAGAGRARDADPAHDGALRRRLRVGRPRRAVRAGARPRRGLAARRPGAAAPDDPAFSERQRTLVRLADALHDTGAVDDELWPELEAGWSAGADRRGASASPASTTSSRSSAARFAVEPEPWAAAPPAAAR